MKLVIENASQAFIKNPTSDDIEFLTKKLSYKNTSAAHLVKRHVNNKWFRSKNPEGWKSEFERLKADVDKSLLFNFDGNYYIRPGSIPYLEKEVSVENLIEYPNPRKIPWAKPLPFKLHEYQEQSVKLLIAIKHGNVELCTGAGKSAILLSLCRETGFRAAIVAPSKSIFYELLDKFETHLGKNNVGAFGAGRKKIGKRITICIADSLVNVEKDSPEWEFFSGLEMLCVDESHTFGAETLETVCHGILSNIPYRFFMSGTQTRGDGAEKLLQSIIGKTVYKLSTKEAIEGGFICPHEFVIVNMESSNPNFVHRDSIVMKRAHFLSNSNIAAFIAKLANSNASMHGKQTLVLVEELSQIAMILPLLQVPYAYAHSDTNNSRLAELGLTKVDSDESVEKFNKNEVKVLVGTSCIATGTNIFPVHNCANWVGGSSEIRTKQGAVGRSVRLLEQSPWSAKCIPKDKGIIWDFNIIDCPAMEHQLKKRISYYEDSGENLINYIKI